MILEDFDKFKQKRKKQENKGCKCNKKQNEKRKKIGYLAQFEDLNKECNRRWVKSIKKE